MHMVHKCIHRYTLSVSRCKTGHAKAGHRSEHSACTKPPLRLDITLDMGDGGKDEINSGRTLPANMCKETATAETGCVSILRNSDLPGQFKQHIFSRSVPPRSDDHGVQALTTFLEEHSARVTNIAALIQQISRYSLL